MKSYVEDFDSEPRGETPVALTSTELIGKQKPIEYLQRNYPKKNLDTVVFYGDDGVGKKEMARYTAALLFCKNFTDDIAPCNRDDCRSCRGFKSIYIPEFREITAVQFYDKIKNRTGGLSSRELISIYEEVFLVTNIEELSDSQQQALREEIIDHIRDPSLFAIFTAADAGGLRSDLMEVLSPYAIEVLPPSKEEVVAYLSRQLEKNGIEVASFALLEKIVEAAEGNLRSVVLLPMRIRNNGFSTLNQSCFEFLFPKYESTQLALPEPGGLAEIY